MGYTGGMRRLLGPLACAALASGCAVLASGCATHAPVRPPAKVPGIAWRFALARPGADPEVTLEAPCLGGRPPGLRIATRRGRVDHLDRYLTQVRATADGRPVPIRRGAAGTFTARVKGCRLLVVRYRLALPATPLPGVRPGLPPPPGAGQLPFLSARGGFFLGPATLLAPDVAPEGPVRIRFVLPARWRAALPWPRSKGAFVAPDVGALVRSYFAVGPFEIHRVRAGPSTADLVVVVPGDPAADARLVSTLVPLLRAEIALFDAGPRKVLLLVKDDMVPDTYEGAAEGRSVELNLPPKRSPGLERAASFLVAHELGHTWTCAARPARGPGRLEWFHEGFTDYLGWLAMVRAGRLDRTGLLARVQKALSEAVATAGATGGGSLLDASRRFGADASARRLAHAGGALVAFALDRRLRAEGKDLVGLLRRFRNRWCPAHRTFTLEDLLGVVGAYGGPALEGEVKAEITTKGFPDAARLLAGTGCTARVSTHRTPRMGMGIRVPPKGPATVAAVVPGGPAAAAGLKAGDVLVRLGGRALHGPGDIDAAMAPGPRTVAVVYRRGGHRATATVRPTWVTNRSESLTCPKMKGPGPGGR